MSKEKVIEILKSIKGDFEQVFRYSYHDIYSSLEKAIEAIEKEDRPTGEWQLHGMIYYCSECGHECGESGDNFCGNCGADMREEEEDE